jgi:hypothetical protein
MAHYSAVGAHEGDDVERVLLQKTHGEAVDCADAAVAADAEEAAQQAFAVE